MSILSVSNVTVEVTRESDRITILDRISFSANRGDIISIVGRSGCGKTTLLNTVAGLRSFEGEILFDGSPQRPEIGYAFQTPRLLNWKTIAQNVSLVLHPHRGSRPSNPVSHSLAAFEAESIADKYPLFCSEGEKARAALARALVNGPSLLLLDEPFANLDMLTAERIRQRLKAHVTASQCTVLFVTHNLLEAAEMSDQILVLASQPARVTAIVPGVRLEQDEDKALRCFSRLRRELELAEPNHA